MENATISLLDLHTRDMVYGVVDALVALRKEQGKSLAFVAARVGCSISMLSEYERKTKFPTVVKLCAWAPVLGYKLEIKLVRRERKEDETGGIHDEQVA